MPPEAFTSLNIAFTDLRSVMPSSPTGPLSMKNPPTLMVSAVTPTSVAPPLPWAGTGVARPVFRSPGAAVAADGRLPPDSAAALRPAAVPPAALTAGAAGPAADPEGVAPGADTPPAGVTPGAPAAADPAAGEVSVPATPAGAVAGPAPAAVGGAGAPVAALRPARAARAPRCFGCSPAQAAALTMPTTRTGMKIAPC